MSQLKKILLSLFVLPLWAFGQISAVLENWKKDKDLEHASISFCVLNASDSELVSEYNSKQLLVPASTLKIITTSAALNLLGSNYRYETKLYYAGSFDKATGILDGDLIILGSGDPTLQSENFTKDNTLITDKWAKVLKDKGLKEIKGNIIGDASCFERTIPSNWIWEDISNYFGAIPCGLSYRDNKFRIVYDTKEKGSLAKVVTSAPSYLTNTFTIISDVVAKGNEDQAYAYGDPFSYTKEIHGSLPPNKTNYEIELALPDPALLCAENLYTSCLQSGIKCSGKVQSVYKKTEGKNYDQLIYTHLSPSLDKIVFYTNMKSNNHYCETLLRTIGKGNANAGLRTVKNHWSQRGLDTSEIYLEDASGLARINGATTHFQSALLSKIFRDSSNYKAFNPSLPVAGKQGSMSSLGKGNFIENNMRAKTGYLTRARAYCGYVRSRSGKDLAFSIIFNNYSCSAQAARLKMEKFLVALGEL